MNAQGSPEWHEDRRGRATASMFSAVLAKGEGKTRKAYMLKLAAERLTGKVDDNGFSNKHTERGTEQEPFARLAYEARTGEIVREVGFVAHPEIMAGASPDGLTDDGGVEIKSVIPTVQIETVMKGGYPTGHKAQVQGNMWITGRPWWDFVSYSPDMPENLRLYVFRVERDEEYIAELGAEVMKFLDELDKMVAGLLK